MPFTIPATLERRLVALEHERDAHRPLQRLSGEQLFATLGLAADDWQLDLLDSQEPRLLLNIHRQGGKSQSAALLALATALYDAALVLVVSPGLRQSRELFRKVLLAYRALGKPIAARVENQLELELANGGRVVALPGSEATIRGYSGCKLLILEEAARIPDLLYIAVRPFLAVSGGRLVVMSTPWAKRGFFYEAWKERKRWDYYQVKASQCPRISPAFLEEERRTLGQYWYEVEYECVFHDTHTSAFTEEMIMRAFKEDIETWDLSA